MPQQSLPHLPPEVLSQIFVALDPGMSAHPPRSGEPRLRIPYWMPLIAVCRYWRNIIVAAAEFWRVIDVGRRTEWLKLCLERSGPDGLVIVSFRSADISFARALEILAPHAHRIAGLYCWSIRCDENPIMSAILPFSMPALTTLGLRVQHTHSPSHNRRPRWHTAVPSIPLTDEAFSKLRSLGLFSLVPTVNPQSALSDLRSLQLAGLSGYLPTSYKLSDFFALLNKCGCLEELSLPDALAGVMTDLPQWEVMALPNLRILTIGGTVERVCRIISHMQVPPHANIKLSTVQASRSPHELLAALFNILPRDQRARDRSFPILRFVSRVKVEVHSIGEENYTKVIGIVEHGPHSGGRFELVVTEKRQPPSGALINNRLVLTPSTYANMANIFPAGPQVTTVVGYGSLGAIHLKEYLSVLRSYPNLRNLIMHDSEYDGNVCDAFKALRGVAPSGQTQSVVLCPRLEYIWFRNAAITLELMEEIESCVEWRIQQGTPIRRLRLEMHAERSRLERDGIAGNLLEVWRFTETMKRLVPVFELRIWETGHGPDLEGSTGIIDDEIPF
ncbi:hypothetical protein C8Q74DRAFT_104604 [Fomes fomentarius]|nr:hypothetical protein C8Q74DRAFT_104604 [Fomes fomentarius]